MEIAIIILGLFFALLGFFGCIFPLIPGPPLSFGAIILLSYAKNWTVFDKTFLVVSGVFALVIVFLDYFVSVLGAKKFGASKQGLWGSIIGMLAGMLFFPPLGMFIGAILGALAGELLAGKTGQKALRAGWGVFVGNLVGVGLKLAYCGILLFFYVQNMF